MGKAAERHEHNLRKAERREEEIRERFAAQGGLMGPVMQAILRYFHTYATKPRPDLFMSTLGRVSELGLMQLSEHRHSLAGAIAAVVALHPEHQDAWRKGIDRAHPDLVTHTASGGYADLARIVGAAERLSPPITDEEISRTGETEYLWMTWVVTRDMPVLQRLVRLASRQDRVGESALALLYAHAHLPEVTAVLSETLQRRQSGSLPSPRGIVPTAALEAIAGLKQAVAADPFVRRRVVLVGWLPDPAPVSIKGASSAPNRSGAPTPTAVPTPLRPSDALTGSFLIVTVDGTTPATCPTTWLERPVHVRKAKADEMRAHQMLLQQAEEP